jgi:hypothetical protein
LPDASVAGWLDAAAIGGIELRREKCGRTYATHARGDLPLAGRRRLHAYGLIATRSRSEKRRVFLPVKTLTHPHRQLRPTYSCSRTSGSLSGTTFASCICNIAVSFFRSHRASLTNPLCDSVPASWLVSFRRAQRWRMYSAFGFVSIVFVMNFEKYFCSLPRVAEVTSPNASVFAQRLDRIDPQAIPGGS